MPNKIENQIPLKRIIKQNQKRKITISKLADAAKRAVWPCLVFNLSNEMSFKFNLCVFGDKSQEINSRTSFLTQTKVIYLETESARFEISRKSKSGDMEATSVFTFSKVLKPEILDNEFFGLRTTKIPLETKYR